MAIQSRSLLMLLLPLQLLLGLWSCREQAAAPVSASQYREDTTLILRLHNSVFTLMNRKPDSALLLLEVIKQKSEAIGFERGIVMYYNLACDIYANNGKDSLALALAHEFWQRARHRSPYLNFKSTFIKGLVFQANTETSDSAISYYLKCMDLLKEESDLKLRHYEITALYTNLAILHYYEKNYRSAVFYSNLALEQCRHEKDTAGMLSTGDIRAFTYLRLKDTNRALRIAKENLGIARALPAKSFSLFNALDNIGGMYLAAGHIDSAIASMREAVQLSREKGYVMARQNMYLNLAECYLKQGQIDSSAYWLSQQKAVLDAGGADLREHHGYYELLTDVADSQGHLAIAFNALRKAYDLVDSISKEVKDEQLLEHEKELTRIRSEKELLKKQQQIYKERQTSWQLGLGSFMLIAFAGYSFYRRNKRKEAEREQQIISLRNQAFFNQMKPHFIFNAITPLQTQIMSGKVTDALEYLSDFGMILRKMLVQYNSGFSTLATLKDFVESYLKIQQQAANMPFTYTFEIDPALDLHQAWLPSMILQPILENSIVHGINNIADGHISITIKREDPGICIRVEDNGVGLPNESLFKKDHALQILEDRLLIDWEQYGVGSMEISNRKDARGVLVKLHVPLLTHNPELP